MNIRIINNGYKMSNNKIGFLKKRRKKVEKPKFPSINEFLRIFEKKELLENITENKGSYFLISEELKEEINRIKLNYFSAGVFLGFTKRNEFFPSIALVENVGENARNIITIDKKTEWLFLCGRDIFHDSLNNSAENETFENKKNFVKEQNTQSKVTNGYVIIKNERKEILGIGYGTNNLILNVIDRGDFLRRENKKRR